MSLSGLLRVIGDDPQLKRALDEAEAPASIGADLIAPPALRPFLAAALAGAGGGDTGRAGEPGRFVLAVTATAREAEDLTAALGSLLPARRGRVLPALGDAPARAAVTALRHLGQRLAVLRRLAHPDPADPRSGPLTVVATPVRSVLQPIVGGLGELEPVRLRRRRHGRPGRAGHAAGRDRVRAQVELVGNRGEIAVRGGILDVFPPTDEHPLRVEFFGDTVEEIRLLPGRRPAQPGTAPTTASGRRRAASCCSPRRCGSGPSSSPTSIPACREVLGKLADGITVEGMEAFAPVLADRMELLLDYVPAGALVLACDPERIRARAADLVRTSQEFLEASWVNAAAGGEVPIDLGAAAFRPITEVRSVAGAGRAALVDDHAVRRGPGGRPPPRAGPGPALIPGTRIALNPADATDSSPEETGLEADDGAGRDAYRMEASPAEAYRGDTTRVVADVRRWLGDRWRVVLVTEGHGPAQRLVELLRGEDLGARLDAAEAGEPPEAGLVHVTTGTIAHGFIWPSVQLAVLTEADLAGQRTGAPGTSGCRAGGAAASTRCGSSRATTWCTSSTASAGTWR